MTKGLITTVTTPKCRLSYHNLLESKLNKLSGVEEYSMEGLFEPGQDLSVLKTVAENALTNKFGADKNKWPKNLRSPFKDQKEKAKDGHLPDGYKAGAIFMRFKCVANKSRPAIVDQNRNEILESSKIYSGCYVRASVNAYAYEKGGNAGVSFGLNAVQFMEDGEAFSGRPSVESAFEPIAGAATNDANSIF